MTTRVLQLPEITFNQASKHVTHNEALHKLDAWTSVISRTNGGPPGSPATGDSYIVDVATGDWSAFTVGDIVTRYIDSTSTSVWLAVSPKVGIPVYCESEDAFLTWSDSETDWLETAAVPGFKNLPDTTYTFAAVDRNTVLRFSSSSAVTVTVPLNATVAIGVGTVIHVRRAGTGTVTVSAEGGVTINGTPSPSGQHTTTSLMKVDTDEWDAF